MVKMPTTNNKTSHCGATGTFERFPSASSHAMTGNTAAGRNTTATTKQRPRVALETCAMSIKSDECTLAANRPRQSPRHFIWKRSTAPAAPANGNNGSNTMLVTWQKKMPAPQTRQPPQALSPIQSPGRPETPSATTGPVRVDTALMLLLLLEARGSQSSRPTAASALAPPANGCAAPSPGACSPSVWLRSSCGKALCVDSSSADSSSSSSSAAFLRWLRRMQQQSPAVHSANQVPKVLIPAATPKKL
mmetsp:Transcript_33911/g.97603  ORF Transcript_33911/g.97603 Transcript_33911/m.97603 type:complete len:248 (+) Transcript_33911:142-885(+)